MIIILNISRLRLNYKETRKPNPNNANGILKNATIAVPLKYFSNFWRLLEMPLINCKVELNLNGQSIAFCLQLVMIIQMLILIILFLL